MTKRIAILLLFCLGMMIPMAAVSYRVCLLDEKDRLPDCCENCPAHHEDCCAELDTSLDSLVPSDFPEAPPFIAMELVTLDSAMLPKITAESRHSTRYCQPIRGPDTPAAYRSVLSVWSI